MRTISSIILFTFAISFYGYASNGKAGEKEPLRNPLPVGVLAFPEFTTDYERKILPSSGRYHIWSQKRILGWSLAQGFAATVDGQSLGSPAYARGAVFYPPGLHFRLRLPRDELGEFSAFGWELVLDLAFLRKARKSEFLSSSYKQYENILRYKVFIDGIFFREMEIGYGESSAAPVVIAIPFARDPEGRVKVEIRMSNSPKNFGILYDAFLVRKR